MTGESDPRRDALAAELDALAAVRFARQAEDAARERSGEAWRARVAAIAAYDAADAELAAASDRRREREREAGALVNTRRRAERDAEREAEHPRPMCESCGYVGRGIEHSTVTYWQDRGAVLCTTCHDDGE